MATVIGDLLSDESGNPLFLGSNTWTKHVGDVLLRESAVKHVSIALRQNKFNAHNEIASTDIFVQKAEDELKNRSKQMKSSSNICIFAFGLTIIIFLSSYYLAIDFFQINLSERVNPTQKLIAGISKNATFVGIFLGIQYIIISLFRAFLHESLTLDNRIHSLRLGRLFIYIKYSSAKQAEIAQIREGISADDMEKVFGWNIETSTAFKDIDAKQVGKSIWSIFSDLIGAIRRKD